jgi:ParB family chromosome partitioning protein
MKTVQILPIADIRVINPRHRNRAKYGEIVENISKVGLKKPITVSKRGEDEEPGYDLVCGQGRLEAYSALGWSEIPAIVIDVPKEQRLLMSLVENMARRHPRPIEFVRAIASLRERGYNQPQIAEKIGVSTAYVSGILRLLDKGELRLVQAVERGDIPVNVAMDIAVSDDTATQRSLAQAYESGKLRGKALVMARRVVEQRRAHGKGLERGPNRKNKKAVTAEELVRTFKKETLKQKLLVKKARLCERRLRFVTSAFMELLDDENFLNLLRAEKLNTLPKPLEERIKDERE